MTDRTIDDLNPSWMIECKNSFVGWWDGRLHDGMIDCRFFNTDPTSGKRFSSKAEAESAIAVQGHSCQIAVEHAWFGRGDDA